MNAGDIIGFPLTSRFDLAAMLQRAKGAEIARVAGIAEELSRRFGAIIAVGYLYCEIVGRHAAVAECSDLIRRLDQAQTTASRIAAELLPLAR